MSNHITWQIAVSCEVLLGHMQMPPLVSCKPMFFPVGKVGWVDFSFLWDFSSSLCRCWVLKPQNFPVISQPSTREYVPISLSLFLMFLLKKKKKRWTWSFLFLYWGNRSHFSYFSMKIKRRNEETLNSFIASCSFQGNFMASFVPSVDTACGCRRQTAGFCSSSPSSNLITFIFINYCFTKAFHNFVRGGEISEVMTTQKWQYT